MKKCSRCITCNSGLGAFKDNPKLLLAAVTYLTNIFDIRKVA